jgi:hypothetical protein
MIDEQSALRQVNRFAGLEGFPDVGAADESLRQIAWAGVTEVAKALVEASVSDEHARATVDEWLYDQPRFPTPAQLRQVAWSTRPRFQPEFKPKEEKASPMEMTPELRAAWDKAVANVDKQKEMWAAIKRELRITNFAKVSWLQIAECKLKLEYPLNRADQDALSIKRERPAAWDEPPKPPEPPPPPQKPITLIDFERARNEYEKKKFGGDT